MPKLPRIHIKKINNINIKPVPIKNNQSKHVLGYEYFSEPFSNIFLLAKKKSGKTTVIYELLNNIVSPDLEQKVFFFVSTIKKDIIYEKIKALLDKHDIEYEEFDCIEDVSTKENNLKNIMDNIQCVDKDNYSYAENIFIFDDMSEQLQNKYIHKLLKSNRHYKSTCIISSQYITDLTPGCRSQLDYCLAFRNLTEDNLKKLHNTLDLNIDYETFEKIYRVATQDLYNFLYIDRVNCMFRFNFNYEVNVDDYE